MTDQELKEMIAGLTVAQRETDRILKEYAERAEEERRKSEEERRRIEAELAEERRKSEEERRRIEAELADERRKTEETQRRLAEELAEERRNREEAIAEEHRKIEERRKQLAEELAEERKKTEEERKKTEETQRRLADELAEERRKTERVIRQVHKQLGELGNKFGSFTEGMAFPSMEKILRNRFKMDVVALRAKSQYNGASIEIDVMAHDNGSRNEVYLVEVKSHLTRESVDQMLKTIQQFPKFFGAHSHRAVYGIIAAVDIPDNMRAEVLNRGLYLARIHDGTFELLTPPGFRPTPFGPAAKQNGRTKKRLSGKK